MSYNKNKSKKSVRFLALFLLFFVFSRQFLFAQKHEFGLSLGSTNYTGDLAPGLRWQNFKGAGEVFYRFNYKPAWHFRGGLLYGRLGADDRNNTDELLKARDFMFKSDLLELSARAEYNFFNFRRKRGRFERWSPYLFAGITYSHSEAQSRHKKEEQMIDQLVIPFGIGVKHYINMFWNLGFEIGARKTFIDNLDGYEFNPDADRYRMLNPENTDTYYYVGISLSYILNGVDCPKFYKFPK